MANSQRSGRCARKSLRVQVPPAAPSMYEVYILRSLKDFRTYTGYSEDARLRLTEHNKGKVKATRHRRPLKIIYIEKISTLSQAKSREKYWKSGAGRRKFANYFKGGFPPAHSE